MCDQTSFIADLLNDYQHSSFYVSFLCHVYVAGVYQVKFCSVITIGRQHLRQICFCRREAEASTLLRYSFWPSSPNRPQLAFHIDLLKWLHGLQMECQVSVKSFCDALHTRLPKHQKGLESREVFLNFIVYLFA